MSFGTATAQDAAAQKKAGGGVQPAATGDAKKARAEFDKAYGEWKEMMTRLADLNNKYQAANEDERVKIEKQYTEEAARGEKMAEQLKSVTEAAFLADPTDKEVAKLLGVMAISAFRQDNYEEVKRFARPLLERKINEQQMAWLAANAAYGLHEFQEVIPLVQRALKVAPPSEQLQKEAQALLEGASETAPLWPAEQKIREAEAKADDLPRVKLQTTKGDITIELFENEAPNTVANFISLVEKGFYNGISFHRVLPNFMAQGGDPAGTGSGGPGYRIKDEFDNPRARMHFRGTLSMANTGQPNTNGSQFFLTFRPTHHLNGRHTVFGRVIEGRDVLPDLQRIDPQNPSGAQPDKIVKATVVRKRDHEYKPETLRE